MWVGSDSSSEITFVHVRSKVAVCLVSLNNAVSFSVSDSHSLVFIHKKCVSFIISYRLSCNTGSILDAKAAFVSSLQRLAFPSEAPACIYHHQLAGLTDSSKTLGRYWTRQLQHRIGAMVGSGFLLWQGVVFEPMAAACPKPRDFLRHPALIHHRLYDSPSCRKRGWGTPLYTASTIQDASQLAKVLGLEIMAAREAPHSAKRQTQSSEGVGIPFLFCLRGHGFTPDQ